MLQVVLKTVVTNLATMFVTDKVIIWALELAVKKTKNQVDDSVVKIVKGAYQNDFVAIKSGTEDLLNTITEEVKEDKQVLKADE